MDIEIYETSKEILMENNFFWERCWFSHKSMILSFSNRGKFWENDSSDTEIKGFCLLSLLDLKKKYVFIFLRKILVRFLVETFISKL